MRRTFGRYLIHGRGEFRDFLGSEHTADDGKTIARIDFCHRSATCRVETIEFEIHEPSLRLSVLFSHSSAELSRRAGCGEVGVEAMADSKPERTARI